MGVVVRTSQANTAAHEQVRPLTSADIDDLAFDPRRGLDADDVLSLLIQQPGGSFWHPDSGEFVLVTSWRHRPDLPTIHTISAIHHETALLRAATEAARHANAAALVYVDSYEIRRPAFYVNHAFQRIEDIVTFELDWPRPEPIQQRRGVQQFIRVPIRDTAWIAAVIQVDNDAFPWFWWNTRAEFEAYLQFPGVEVWAGVLDDEVVSYVGFTDYYGWGHLDRIAIRPDHQRRGLGREALSFAIDRMVTHGGKRVALSTQGNNIKSQKLYLDYGFTSTPVHDYAVYGVVFDPGRVIVHE